MIWWTGLAPWEFGSPFPGSRMSTFLDPLTIFTILQEGPSNAHNFQEWPDIVQSMLPDLITQRASRTVDYDPVIKSELASMQWTFGPDVVQIWSRDPQILRQPSMRRRNSPHAREHGPVDLSFRALSGRLKFTVRRHNLNNDSLSSTLSTCP